MPVARQTIDRLATYSVALNLAAVGVSLINVPLALAMFVSVPLLNMSQRRVDQQLREIAGQ